MTDLIHQRNETLRTTTSEVRALVMHGLRTLERHAEKLRAVRHADAMSLVADAIALLEAHEKMLTRRMNDLGATPSGPITGAVAALTTAAAAILDNVRRSEIVRSLHDDATFFSDLGFAFLLLYTTAEGLGDPATAAIAQRGYVDAARMVMRLDRALPHLALEELREGRFDVSDVEMRVHSMVGEAWHSVQAS